MSKSDLNFEEQKILDSRPEWLGDNDPVNRPAHYTAHAGTELIQLTAHLNFCRGYAVKYITRAGLKVKSIEIQDLEKVVWYVQREIERLRKVGK